MAKGKEIDWSPVWDKVVRLYRTHGVSLSELMAILEDEDDFVASRRAFWNKLKAAGITGVGKTSSAKLLSGQTLIGATLPEATLEDLTSRQTTHLVDPAPSMTVTSEDGGRPRKRARRSPAPPTQAAIAADDLSEITATSNIHLQLLCAIIFDHRSFLDSSTVADARNTILHYSVQRRGDHLDAVLRFVRSNDIDIDYRSTDGYTPLELAIVNDDHISVGRLLEVGASASTRDHAGDTPLHRAIRHRVSDTIVRTLLKAGAGTCPADDFGSSPLDLLVDLLEAHCIDGALSDASMNESDWVIRNLHSLLTSEKKPRVEVPPTAYEGFVRILMKVRHFCASRGPALLACLAAFLARGCSPLLYVGPDCGSRSPCRTLATVAFYHNRPLGLWNCIIKSSDLGRFGASILKLLLAHPCRARAADIDPCEHLRQLLDSGMALTYNEDAAWCLHWPFYSTDFRQDVPKMLQLLLETKTLPDPHALNQKGWRPIQSLLSSASGIYHPPWDMAEVLLEADRALAIDHSFDGDEHTANRIFIHHAGSCYLEYLKVSYQQHLRRYLCLAQQRGTSVVDDELRRYALYDTHRCVVHVLSQHMIEDSLPEPKVGTRQGRLLLALRIRKAFALPQLHIDQDVLMDCLGKQAEEIASTAWIEEQVAALRIAKFDVQEHGES